MAVCDGLRKEFMKDDAKACQKKVSKVKVAVRNQTFAVSAGEIFGLLGPNGAGKTTTINMMIAETGATHGNVIFSLNFQNLKCLKSLFHFLT